MKSIFSFLRIEVIVLIFDKWKYWIYILCFFILVFFATLLKYNNLVSDNIIHEYSFLEMISEPLIGISVINPLSRNNPQIPYLWIMFYIVFYIYNLINISDENKNSLTNYVLRLNSRKSFILSKIINNSISAIIYHTVYIISYLILYLIFSQRNFSMDFSGIKFFYDLSLDDVGEFELFLSIIIFPLILNIFISILQIFLSLYIKPLYGLIVIIIYMITSMFVSSPIFLFNIGMIKRNISFLDNFIPIAMMLVLIVSLVLYLSINRMQKKDIF